MHLCAEPPTPPSPFHLFRCLCPRGLLWSDPLPQVSLAMPTYSWHALLHVATLHDEVLFFQIYPTRPVLELVFVPQPLHLSRPQCGHEFLEPLVDIMHHGLRNDPYNGAP